MALNDTLKTRILLRNDTLANWEGSNLVLGKGEVAIATLTGGELAEVRVGTGSSTWATALKLNVNADQISGLVETIQGTAKKYQVVANGEGGNSWKLQEAALSGGDWSDVAGSTWTVDFSAITYAIDGLISEVNYISGIVDTKLDKTTFSTISNDIGLSAASVDNPVATKDDIAALDNVMHFRGVVTAAPIATTGYEVGDIVLVAGATGDAAVNNGKEYVLVDTGTNLEWELIGDQNAISALNSYVDTKIENLSNTVSTDYVTKTEVNDISDYLSGAIDNLSDEITSITGNYATKDYVNGISSFLSTDYVGKISTAKSEVIGESTDLSSDDTVNGAKAYAKDYTDEKIADLNIDNYATKEYVNGISSSLSTDYVGKIKAVDDKLSDYALCADVTSEIAAAKSEVIGEETDLSSADTVNGAKAYAKDYTDEKIADLDNGLSDYIKHGECVQSDLSGFFILDCGGSSLRDGEPAA